MSAIGPLLTNYTFILYEETDFPNDPDLWSRPSSVDCNTIRIVGIFLCVAALVGISCNGMLFYSFIRHKSLRSPSNIFFMFIAGLGLFASCTILPFTGTSAIYCQWLYTAAGCKLSAIIAFLYGCSSSYLLCGASLSRCYIIVRPFKAKHVTTTRCIIIACIAVFIAFIWTLLPLLGWNEYTMERARTSCCINWYDRRLSYVSYTFSLFVFVYCVPLAILISTNAITLIGLKTMREKIEMGIQTALSRKRVEMERRIVKSILFTTGGFIFTWTPYAVTMFFAAFRQDYYALPALLTFFCACFAKTSVIWIPLIYIATSTHFQLRFVSPEALDQQTGSNRIEAGPLNGSTIQPTNGTTHVARMRDKDVPLPLTEDH